MKVHEYLICKSLELGLKISVFDGEEWQIKRSTNKKEILSAINSVEECELRFRNKNKEIVGWAKVSPFGLEDNETVRDCSTEAWMGDICEQYDKFYPVN